MEENMFELVPVKFGDMETFARPFEFSQDSDENFVAPIKGITTCPHCGHGQEVDMRGKTFKNPINLKCVNCNTGNEDCIKPTPEDTSLDMSTDESINDGDDDDDDDDDDDIEAKILAALEEDEDEDEISPQLKASITIDESEEIQTLKSNSPFMDPIELGLFQIDEL